MAIKFKFPQFISTHFYLLILAAWLLTFSFIIDNYWSPNTSSSYIEAKITAYVQGAEDDFKNLTSDTSYTGRLFRGELDDGLVEEMNTKKYFVFIYNRPVDGQPVLRYWNTQTVLPDSILFLEGPAGFIKLPNGYYVWNKKQQGNMIAIALLPIKWNYIITNDYLQNVFVQDPEIGREYAIYPGKGSDITVTSIYDVPLYHLVRHSSIDHSRNNIISIWFRLLAVVLLLIFVHICATYLASTRRFLVGTFFLITIIFISRALSYFVPFPLQFRQFELFDPAIYGSNFILRSLGDLLINAILFVWIVLFVRYQVHEKDIRLRVSRPAHKWILLAGGSLIIVAATFTCGYIIRSLVADSQISFDVINFFSLSFYSVIGFIVLCCLAIGYYFLCQLILFLLKPFYRRSFIEIYISVAIIGLLLLTFGLGPVSGGFAFYSLIWLLGFIFLLNNTYLNLIASRIITSRLVFWLFFFSITITSIIIKENDVKELRNRLHYAEILATKADPASETLLNTMLTDFRVDFLSNNFNRLRNIEENQYLKDSLINNNFSGYTNRYDTKVFSYDANEEPLFNSENFTYNHFNTILNTQARATSIEGLYYYDQSYDLFNYISKKTIFDFSGNLLGTLFIIVSPKNIKSETLYPELFSKGQHNAIENSSLYAFAIYHKNRLITSHNDYPFATILPGRYFAGQPFLLLKSGNYDELWYNAGADKYVVIVKEHRISIESITLFSYLFCAFLLLTAAFWLVNILVRSRLEADKLKAYWQLTIRNQIHGIIIFISAVSFIVIGIATILFFIGRYESNNREQLSRAINIMVYQTSKALSEGWRLDTDSVSTDARNIEQVVNNISEIHGVDINIYDTAGNLKVSSLPLPYAKGIVSTKIDPVAYYHLHLQKEVQYFQKENIGKLNFVSSYVPVMTESGDPYVYLNIPYFTSESKLKEEISNFLVTIINLNAFIFLIAGIVALFITNRITNSFSLISEKMKKINLGRRNEAIEWHRNDEIGELVIEYNKMLNKLDESAAALAKTEREGAWREMARQVAHEIKNPLTPMKLSMQFLQRSIENNSANVKELAANVSNTLIEQIDHLSKIAGEFSQFANIGNANKEKMNLNDALKSVKRLYSGNEKTKFRWSLLKEPAFIFADKTHINRLFTNLIQNALQAVPENKPAEISIEEELGERSVLIRVTDNGDGIDESIQDNIFTPNFTTKTSGTGLGLAMCKRIVEQSNGQIWFETAAGEGTTFYIIIPLDKV